MPKNNEFVQSDPFDTIYPDGKVESVETGVMSNSAPNLTNSILEKEMQVEQTKRANHVDNYIASLMANIKVVDDPGLEIVGEFTRQKFKSQSDPTYQNQTAEARQIVTSRQSKVIADMIDEGFSQGVGNPDDLQEAADTQREIAEQNNSKSIEQIFVDSLSLEEDELLRQEQEWQISALKDISDLMEDQSAIDKIVNYTGLFVLSDQGIDWSRVLGTDTVESGEAAERFVNKFQAMPPEAKARLWPELKEALSEATDENNIKTALGLMTLLDPTAPEELRSEIGLSNVFLGVDMATLGGALLSRIAKLTKATNSIKALKIVGDKDTAAQMSTAAGIDKTGRIKGTVGVADDIPTMNGQPFKVEDMVPEAADGINKEVQNIIREVDAGRRETFNRLQNTIEDTLKEGMLFEREKTRVIDKVVEATKKYREEIFEKHGWSLDDVAVTDSTDDGFTLTYKIEGVPVEKTVKYTLDDIGEFVPTRGDELKTGAIEGFLASPAFKLSDKELVNSATRVELQRAKIAEIFTKRTHEITTKTLGSPLNPANSKKYKNVDDVLLAGDDFEDAAGVYGKVFSIQELRNGVRVQGDKIVRLSDKEITAYYQLRDLFDNAWIHKNQATRRALKVNGVKEVMFEGLKTMAKPFESAGRALRSLEERGVHSIFDPTLNGNKGGVRRISDIDLEDLYDRGYQVVRFHKGSQEFGQKLTQGQHISHAIVKNTAIRELPQTVIHYKRGYVPRIDKNGYYFVKEPIKGTLDGVAGKTVGSRTLRIFDNKLEADKYAKSLADETPGKEYQVLHDRQMAEMDLADEALGLSGGLYTSPRASHPILFGADGVARQRLTAFESLQRNLAHLSNLLPRNEWRIGVQQRWLNTARSMFDKTGTGIRREEGFHAHISGETHTKEWRALDQARKYINDQLRIPTTEEKVFADAVRGIVQRAEGIPLLGAKKLQPVRNFAMDIASKDPFSAARGLTFHALLGWYNPAQLIVQAQGASVALSLHPLTAKKAIQSYMPLRHMMNIPVTASREMVEKQANMAAKASGMKVDEVLENYDIWRRSGLQESIKSTADHSATAQGYGMAMSSLRNVADKGLFFYREGEFFNRGYGLITAKQLWKKANPGKAIDEAAEKEILSSAMSLQLNMTRANRAAWQRGALSIPTQFLQVSTKFAEKLLGKDFGDAGRARLLLGQMGLYGSAGIVGGNWMVNEMAQIADVTPEEIDPELKRWLRGGVYDYMLYSAFGADVEVGRRGAIASGVEDMVEELLYGDDPTAEVFMGAFGAVGSRTAAAWKSLEPLVVTTATGDRDFTVDDAKIIASELASVVSTWRNVDKAMLMHRTGLATTSRGNITVDNSLNGGFNMAEIIFQGLGFQSTEVQDVYSMQQWLREEKQHLDARTEALVNIHYKYASRESHDTDRGNTTKVLNEYIMSDLSPHQRQTVLDRFRQRVTQAEDTKSRVIRQYYRDRSVDITNALTSLPATNLTIPTPDTDEEEQ